MFTFFEERKLLLFIIPILSGLIFYSLIFSFSEVEAATLATTSLTVSITVCGDGVVEGSEQCDGGNLAGQTCEGLGYFSGDLACDGSCVFDTSGCTTGPGGVGGSPWWQEPPAKETKVILQGKAYPNASITILVDGKIINIIKADSQADFETEINNLTAGNYNFGLWAQDSEGRRSITFSFSVSVSSEMTTNVSGLFIPPTVELKKDALNRGEILDISGQTASQGEVDIYIGSIIKETEADSSGKWSYSFDTLELGKENSYLIKVKAISPEGLKSNFSSILKFILGEEIVGEACLGADFNKDNEVNLIDFSILLYWWEKYNPCVDQNQDGAVDLQDFSIMMYYWTG
jgi:hypothetical protein